MQAALNPRPEFRTGSVTLRTNVDEASHWSAGEIHGPRMWLRDCFMVGGWARTDDKVLAHYPTAHMTVHHERQPANHSLFHERKVAA
jgi:hypothetical protein